MKGFCLSSQAGQILPHLSSASLSKNDSSGYDAGRGKAAIRRLEAADAGVTANARKVGKPGMGKKSAATRAKMAEAQKVRWAKRGKG
jgi:hypothetical protein